MTAVSFEGQLKGWAPPCRGVGIESAGAKSIQDIQSSAVERARLCQIKRQMEKQIASILKQHPGRDDPHRDDSIHVPTWPLEIQEK